MDLINSQASLSNLIEVKTIFYIVFLPLAFAILFFLTLLTFWSCAQVTRGDLNPRLIRDQQYRIDSDAGMPMPD
jgi:hypothetical protein